MIFILFVPSWFELELRVMNAPPILELDNASVMKSDTVVLDRVSLKIIPNRERT